MNWTTLHDPALGDKQAPGFLLEKGDASYAVLTSSLRSLAELAPADALKLARPWLNQPSYQDALRRAALSAFGAAHDPSTFDTVVMWGKRGHPSRVRAAAIQALGQFAGDKKLAAAQHKQAVDILVKSLGDDEPRSVRFAALAGLRGLGSEAAPALGALRAMVQKQGNPFMQRMLQRMIDSIESAEPSAKDVKKLRAEVERLRRENRALKEQLKKRSKAA